MNEVRLYTVGCRTGHLSFGLIAQNIGTNSHCVKNRERQGAPPSCMGDYHHAVSQGGGVRRHGRTPEPQWNRALTKECGRLMEPARGTPSKTSDEYTI